MWKEFKDNIVNVPGETIGLGKMSIKEEENVGMKKKKQ